MTEHDSIFWLEALPQATLLTQSGYVSAMNEAASQLWGVPSDRAVGRPVLEVVRRHTLEHLLGKGGTLEIEIEGRLLLVRAIRRGDYGALVAEDLTEHRRREAELREATAILSHEFRTPVTGLRGVLEALEYEMPPEMSQHFVRQGLQEVERLARLVEDLAVGFRPTRARTLALTEAFERADRLLVQEANNRGVTLEWEGNYPVRADPDKLLQVLLNLVENALKYGSNEGDRIRIVGTWQGNWVEVAVLDSGTSLELGEVETLFEAHKRGKEACGSGSGMGLYIVRSIVSGWGGAAWATRRDNENAFCFTIPAGLE